MKVLVASADWVMSVLQGYICECKTACYAVEAAVSELRAWIECCPLNNVPDNMPHHGTLKRLSPGVREAFFVPRALTRAGSVEYICRRAKGR